MGDEGALDAVILGASGFAAKYVLREFLRHLERPEGQGRRRIGIAGRNREKLAEALRWAAQGALPPSVPIIEADVTDAASMAALCKRTRLIVNCVGPFRLYGEAVVAACVEAGVDYLDITGEPKFMERMEEHYHSSALLAGSLVVSACGYEYVTADLGRIFHSRQWKTPSVPHSVDAYVVLESEKRVVLNVTTFESIVVDFAHRQEDQKLRTYGPQRPQIPGLPAPKSKSVEHQKSIGLWALKLPAGDAAVARRTQALLAENPYGLPGVNENSDVVEKRRKSWSEVKPVYFDVYIGYKCFWSILLSICMGLIVFLLGQFRWGRSLLLKYPGIFTLGLFRKTGPTEEEVRSASFKYWFVGHGYSDESRLLQQGSKPDMEVVTRISGPEIGYATTPIILVQCALIVMDQRQSLPKGGVFPPGIVFGSTDLQERLEKNGILFELLSKKTVL